MFRVAEGFRASIPYIRAKDRHQTPCTLGHICGADPPSKCPSNRADPLRCGTRGRRLPAGNHGKS